jgi:hypothetical protein
MYIKDASPWGITRLQPGGFPEPHTQNPLLAASVSWQQCRIHDCRLCPCIQKELCNGPTRRRYRSLFRTPVCISHIRNCLKFRDGSSGGYTTVTPTQMLGLWRAGLPAESNYQTGTGRRQLALAAHHDVGAAFGAGDVER